MQSTVEHFKYKGSWIRVKFLIFLGLIFFVAMQDKFINELKVVVAKKQKVKMIIDEGWYSELEMKSDLGWQQ